MVFEYDGHFFLTEEDGQKYDELLHKQKMIDDKICRYKREKAKSVKILSNFKVKKNLKTSLPDVLQSSIVNMISSPALTKLLDQSFSKDKNIHCLIERVNSYCDHINTSLNISDTDEKIFDSEEEALCVVESKKSKSSKRKKTSQCGRRQKQLIDGYAVPSPCIEEKISQIETDLFLSDSDDN